MSAPPRFAMAEKPKITRYSGNVFLDIGSPSRAT